MIFYCFFMVWGRILERVRILIFEIIVVFTIISNIMILSLRLSVSAILEIFKKRLSVNFLLKLRQLPTCRNFYDELYQPTLQHVQWHLYACDVTLYAKLTCGMFSKVYELFINIIMKKWASGQHHASVLIGSTPPPSPPHTHTHISIDYP